ncbi:MAG: MBL fold metallo-hydrolase [Candidatus Thermoplasmatota archaeon]|nr:MBL fold metallo-hydrolase [Euryarchaeota archaeon]MBU4031847.1 MBL fold metallo-hydrolase [Candidatus Thermoplasmatota archaeon]MBU4071249.1 MBL fold metallo-hydrolase [Candidatus Thermoplasmatota archaeon]MBU4144832.1 MBL fold metallo-hydrolase [Candidatus Thermoplasmatota archaeon]MBU4591961.1 MBL fold metallo-hydrolase [Candidatus Thermoplasmatota archaeon]
MEIRQFLVGDNFSYVIYCGRTRKAVLIDPGLNASEAMKFIGYENLELLFIINTHHHRDHVSETARVQDIYKCDVIASVQDSARMEGVTKTVADSEVMMLGDVKLEFILTPGHTAGSICVLADGRALFTGDTLFIGDCGRTDMDDGSPADMYASMQKLKALPDDIVMYPGHDYGPKPTDTLGGQKRTNKTLLADSFEAFSHIP